MAKALITTRTLAIWQYLDLNTPPMSNAEKRQFLRPSPNPPSRRKMNSLAEEDKHNNIVAFHWLKELNGIMQFPEYWNSLPPTLKGEINQIRSLAFEGFYPNEEDMSRICTAIVDVENEHVRDNLFNTIQAMRELIQKQEGLWSLFKEYYPDNDLIQIEQDTITALHYLPDENGGKLLTFGSARTKTGSAIFDAARWLNETIVTGSLDEDGLSEGVISGAGPGIMKAANYGAMQGRWNIIQQLEKRAEQEPEAEVYRILATARLQMHSIGIRIALPFEASWNDHLQMGLTIKNFAPRKAGLVSTAIGRSIMHNGTESKHAKRHPGIFAFPGGFGTEDEVWEVACLVQCGKMPEAPIFSIGKKASNKYDHAMETMLEWGAISTDDKELIIRCKDEIEAVEQYHDYYNLEPSTFTKAAMSSREATVNNGSAEDTNGYRD